MSQKLHCDLCDNYDTDPLGYLAKAEAALDRIQALQVEAAQALACLKAQGAPKPSFWRRICALVALTITAVTLSGCGGAQMAGMYPGNWVDGPDHGRKVFCVGSDKSISCDWVGYHRDDHR
jgi:hypothetical protein